MGEGINTVLYSKTARGMENSRPQAMCSAACLKGLSSESEMGVLQQHVIRLFSRNNRIDMKILGMRLPSYYLQKPGSIR
jgi:hypothetical protein